jgi:hypothetical protein
VLAPCGHPVLPYVVFQILLRQILIQGLMQFVVIIFIVVTDMNFVPIVMNVVDLVLFALFFCMALRSSSLIWMATEKCW